MYVLITQQLVTYHTDWSSLKHWFYRNSRCKRTRASSLWFFAILLSQVILPWFYVLNFFFTFYTFTYTKCPRIFRDYIKVWYYKIKFQIIVKRTERKKKLTKKNHFIKFCHSKSTKTFGLILKVLIYIYFIVVVL
jgi:hypothetical protein